MNFILKSHHVDITEALKDYAEKKLSKLSHFFDHIQAIRVNLNIESASSEQDRQEASAVIDANATTIKASESTADMYSSIDLLYDKLRVQLTKHKEKITHHKGHHSASVLQETVKKQVASQTEEGVYIPKPMGVEDAVARMFEDKLKVLVFRDLKERICVVYPTEKGRYGLINT